MPRWCALFALLLVSAGLAQVSSRAELEAEAMSLETMIGRERDALIQNLHSLIDLSPTGKYNDLFLFRLSELYYERAVINFDNALRQYDEDYGRFERGELKQSPLYPDYDFKPVLSIYQDILQRFPQSEIADDVLYFTGLCHKKANQLEKANQAFEVMVAQYPSADYLVDAYMEIGAYYFNNPEALSGTGYEHSIEIYKQVLRFRDSEKFTEALYRLAWAYYMTDQYEQAVTVFRHLLEEIDVTQGYGGGERKKRENPLFKDEALDYIALSLAEVDSLSRARRFLDMIGSRDYSSMVLNKMGGRFEEQLEYDRALECYLSLVRDFPLLPASLDGQMGVIRSLERKGDLEGAQSQKEKFFQTYARGGPWQEKVKEAELKLRADSLSVKCILSVAQYCFMRARKENDRSLYQAAIRHYRSLHRVYPDDPGAYEGLWNTAVIFEQQLSDLDSAYTAYLAVSARPEAKYKQQAGLNAIAMAQRLEEGGAADESGLSPRDRKIIGACRNFVSLFPKSKESIDAYFIAASLLFNRKRFSDALRLYDSVLTHAPVGEKARLDAHLFKGQCYTGLQDYANAEKAFQALYAEAPEGKFRDEAKKRRVESAFQFAEEKRKAQDFTSAAALFLEIEKKYPDFTDMDIVLFNAADAFEKLQKYKLAAEVYRRIAQNYPASKFADGALFNGAVCFENDSAYAEAVKNYQWILDKYPASDKAKDALYNMGLNYDKLKDYARVAEVNEQYAERYPESKDVEQMLYASANYFLKAEQFDRARQALESYTRRYPGSGNEIEARFNLSKIYFKKGEAERAERSLHELIDRNRQLTAGGKNNDYFAAEAAFRLAGMIRERYMAVRLTQPEAALEKQQKEKAQLLKETINAYSKIIELKSERLFEAAYRIGEAYAHFADVYYSQERNPKLTGVKVVVFERDLNLAAISLYEKCIEPHLANLALAKNFKGDSLKAEQRYFISLSAAAVAATLTRLGGFYGVAAKAFLSAPVPDKIKAMPVQYYLYRQKLLETVSPLVDQSIDKYRATLEMVKAKELPDSITTALRDSLGRVLYERAKLSDDLTQEMINAPAIPPEMDAAERDEISFQLEDMAFELQDKALTAYEDGYNFLTDEGIDNRWKGKFLERLRTLDPKTYTPKEILKTVTVATGDGWVSRADSIGRWEAVAAADSAWRGAKAGAFPGPVNFDFGGGRPLWGDSASRTVYLKKLFFLPGRVTGATAAITARDQYRLLLNGALIARDTVQGANWDKPDTFEVANFLKGGDNAVAIQARVGQGPGGLLFRLTVVLDTTQKFTSTLGLAPDAAPATPLPAAAAASTAKAPASAAAAPPAPRVAAAAPADSAAPPAAPKLTKEFTKEFVNYGEFKKAVDAARAREAEVKAEIKRTTTRVRGLEFRIQSMDEKIKATKNDTQVYKKILQSKERKP